MDFSEYIVYIDESGDYGLANINPDHPVFALAFCVVEKAKYVAALGPACPLGRYAHALRVPFSIEAMRRWRTPGRACSPSYLEANSHKARRVAVFASLI
ncbi:DUF3800 domain-containing protein [Bradyrhizobium diazoefficiens]|nr:DUF3800 domain-containing protein [Bradyrhizobium diazoefficiens]QQN63435.1 DUF3800 domain-containing protein [Bradyrhizobium diazoefficiens]